MVVFLYPFLRKRATSHGKEKSIKYWKKLIVVEVFQYTDDVDMVAPKWFTQAVIDEKVAFDRSLINGQIHICGCTINRSDGRLFAKLGTYIIWEGGAGYIRASRKCSGKLMRKQVRRGRFNISQLWDK